MKNEKRNRIISLVIIPLLITAFWEKLLGPMFDVVFDWLTTLGSCFLQATIDQIYTQIATGKYVDTSWYMFIIVVAYILGDLSVTTLTNVKSYKRVVSLQKVIDSLPVTINKKEESDEKKQSNNDDVLGSSTTNLVRKAKASSYISVIIVTLGYASYLLFISISGYVNDTITKLTNNIEIVAPYIEDTEYKILKSAFYSMDSSDDFHLLVDELNRIAELNEVKLKN